MPVTERVATDLPATIKDSGYTLSEGDFGREIQFLSESAVTANLPSVVDAGNGYNVLIRNIGTGNLTIQPDGDGIDGQSTATLSTGAWRWIRSDGTTWKSVSRSGDGAGTVTSITAGAGLEASPANPITASGALSIADGGVTTAKLDDDAVTAAKIASANLKDIAGLSLVQGDILYYDGTDIVALSPGTAGQVLETGGAAANPAWADASGGGAMELIETIAISGSPSTVAFSGSLSGDYDDFVVVARNVQVTSSNTQTGIQCEISSSWVTSGYFGVVAGTYGTNGVTASGIGWGHVDVSNQYAAWGICSASSNYNSTFVMRVFDVHNSSLWKTFVGHGFGNYNNNEPYAHSSGGLLQNTGAITNLRWTLDGSTAVNQGTLSLYGVKGDI